MHIGGEFDYPWDFLAARKTADGDLAGSVSDGGALIPPGAVLTASGRQAFSLLAQHLREAGHRHLIAPAYACHTMIEPFALEGIAVTRVEVGRDMQPEPAALARAAESYPGAPILISETYGIPATARIPGHPLILDRSHSLFAEQQVEADFVVGSLRKLLPIPDGGFVAGIGDPADYPLERTTLDRRVTSERLADLMAGNPREGTEDLVDLASTPAAISPESLELLSRLDVAGLGRERGRNALALATRLRDAGMSDSSTPAASDAQPDPSLPRILAVTTHTVLLELARPADVEVFVRGGVTPVVTWESAGWCRKVIGLPVDQDLTDEGIATIVDLAISLRATYS